MRTHSTLPVAALTIALVAATGIFPRARAGDDVAVPPDPVVDEVVDLARTRALNAPQVDWVQARLRAQALAAAQPGEAGRTAAIRHLLAALADGHSSYRPPVMPGSGAVAHAPSAGASTPNASPTGSSPTSPSTPVPSTAAPSTAGAAKTGTATPPRPIADADTSGTYGRLAIHPWTGQGDALVAATGQVRDALNRAMTRDSCGLILDLSGNQGGNMWPMMGGIAPLYGDGVLLAMEPREGRAQEVIVRDGVLHSGPHVFPRVAGLAPVARRPERIAVLVGPRTASSGEITAIGFRGQAEVRTFGRPTAGATTANASFRLANGGQLALTVSRLRDRLGNVQVGPLRPDVDTGDARGEAERWLDTQCRSHAL